MAHIEPFRALRYDPARVALPSVVTQPYDKITPEMQDRYYASSPYNLVRIILGKQQTGDHPGESTYTRAADFFRDWRRQGIFLQDTQPSVYVYSQRFAIPGGNREAERRGFIALGRLEDYSARVVFRHEQTLAKPKAEHAPYELVMMTFVNLDSPGLVILPTHRVVHGLSSFSADQFCDKARAYFSVEEVDPEIDPGRATAILHEAGRVGTALLAVSADRAFLLDRPKVFDSELFAGLSLRQQSLDVVQLHKCLLEAVLGISEESIRNQQNIRYVRETSDAY